MNENCPLQMLNKMSFVVFIRVIYTNAISGSAQTKVLASKKMFATRAKIFDQEKNDNLLKVSLNQICWF